MYIWYSILSVVYHLIRSNGFEAVKIVRGDTTLASSCLSKRGGPGSMRTLITSCIPTATVDLDISYALFIAETGSPLSILNSDGFHRLLNDLKAQ